MTYIERIVDLDGTVTDRPFTEKETADFDKAKLEWQKQIENEKNEALAKEAQRQALLNKLGITEEEAKLLLG